MYQYFQGQYFTFFSSLRFVFVKKRKIGIVEKCVEKTKKRKRKHKRINRKINIHKF